MKDQIFQKLKEEMEKTISALDKSFSRVRTGRASVSLLDGIKVDYYGAADTDRSGGNTFCSGKPFNCHCALGCYC